MSGKRILLAPGASGSVERLAAHTAGLRRRGLDVQLVPLPRGSAAAAIPVYRAALDPHEAADVVVGGHSFGGRVASLLAAESPPNGLVLLSYPLHAPGRHESWRARTEHWPLITCPVLLLSGESDPFARLDLLRRATRLLPDATLVTWPRLGHGLERVLDEALDHVAGFVARRT